MNTPEKRARAEAARARLLSRLDDYVARYARETPDRTALIEHDTGETVTWKALNRAVDAFAAKLLSLGLKKGDVVATSLPFLKEHVYLEYACFRTGLLYTPLDLRLKAGEILDAFRKVHPKAYFFLGNTPKVDFRPIVAQVMHGSEGCEHWVQFQPGTDGILDGAVHVRTFAKDIKWRYLASRLTGSVRRAHRQVGPRDPALIIFTTGSTGSPKPALLGHENVLIQNIGLAEGFELTPEDRMLVNLPPSHVGGQTEQLITVLFGGGTAVLIHVFDAQKSLEAIAQHKVTLLGQIPALYSLEWRLPDYDTYDLASLRFAIYGGQSVDKPFLERLQSMAGQMGTGLGLTELAGFCTYTPPSWGPAEIGDSIGYDSPLCPLSIREPMVDGVAGAEKAPGEVGEICFSGPQVFLGYLGDEAATRAAISKDGWCYTGDLGWYDERGLHFSGRARFVVKPKGYQVFPGEVEAFITDAFAGRIARTAVVGVPHAVFSEGLVAFVEPADGQTVTRDEIEEKVRDIAAYKRPMHYVFVAPGEMPINRVAKVDHLVLRGRGREEIERLRAEGGWDAE